MTDTGSSALVAELRKCAEYGVSPETRPQWALLNAADRIEALESRVRELAKIKARAQHEASDDMLINNMSEEIARAVARYILTGRHES